MPVYIDSPLTVNLTTVFEKHMDDYDNEAKEFFKRNNNPFHFKNLHYVSSAEESIALNNKKEPCIIISAQGMCEAGRILHHLKNNVENPKNLIMITGYQAANTLGRRISELSPDLKIFGEMYKLKAEVQVMHGFSAHADYKGLVEHLVPIQGIDTVFCVHGEPKSLTSLKDMIEAKHVSKKVIIPTLGMEVEV
jgi:metallo-beta-lactamase family protein